MVYYPVLALVSCIAGFLGGLTGTGGIIIPPVMIEFFGVDAHAALATAQSSYAVPSLLAVAMFMHKRQLDWRVALPVAVPGCICTFLSAWYLKPLFNVTLLSVVFALCIALSGAVMLKPASRSMYTPLQPPWRGWFLAALGGSVGVLAGLTGSGSNAILVPVMVFCGLEVLSVLAACQVFAALASLFGTLGNALNATPLYAEIAWLIGGQLVGIWLGVRLAQRLPTGKLKRYVGWVCLGAGMYMMARALLPIL